MCNYWIAGVAKPNRRTDGSMWSSHDIRLYSHQLSVRYMLDTRSMTCDQSPVWHLNDRQIILARHSYSYTFSPSFLTKRCHWNRLSSWRLLRSKIDTCDTSVSVCERALSHSLRAVRVAAGTKCAWVRKQWADQSITLLCYAVMFGVLTTPACENIQHCCDLSTIQSGATAAIVSWHG